MALLGESISRKKASLQFMGFAIFFSTLESVRSGSSNDQLVQPKPMMTFTLLTRFGNTISLPITSIVWRQYVLHVVLWLHGPNLTSQSHLPIFLIGWEQYIQTLRLALHMSVLTRLVRFYELWLLRVTDGEVGRNLQDLLWTLITILTTRLLIVFAEHGAIQHH